MGFRGEVRANARQHLEGLATYVLFLNPTDRDAKALLASLREGSE